LGDRSLTSIPTLFECAPQSKAWLGLARPAFLVQDLGHLSGDGTRVLVDVADAPR